MPLLLLLLLPLQIVPHVTHIMKQLEPVMKASNQTRKVIEAVAEEEAADIKAADIKAADIKAAEALGEGVKLNKFFNSYFSYFSYFTL